jgi:hypothetical protein
MFAAEEVIVGAGFEAAAARLVHLVNQKALHAPSEAAYEGGLAAVLRVGPYGGRRGLSKLVRVRLLEPARRGVTLTIGVRWEATGLAGDLFPVLDADLMLAAEGTGRARLALTGCYRAPLGRAGAALDRLMMHHLAEATFRSLLDGVADAIADPVPQQHPQADPVRRWWPASEPQET